MLEATPEQKTQISTKITQNKSVSTAEQGGIKLYQPIQHWLFKLERTLPEPHTLFYRVCAFNQAVDLS